MTSRERILRTLRGEMPDRVPIWAWGVHPWLPAVHRSMQPVVDAYLERGDILHWWSPGAGTFLTASDRVCVRGETGPSELPDYDQQVVTYTTPAGEIEEIHYVSREGKPGYCKQPLLRSEEDVDRLLSVPYEPCRPDCSEFHRLDEELGDRGLLIVSLPADPMYFLNNLMGSETFAIWSIERRDLIRSLIAEFARRLTDWTEWVISQGVGPLFGYVGPELCIPPLQSPRDFGEWVIGPDRALNDLIHAAGGLVLVHCHGKMGPVLEGFVDMHCDALHPIEPPPMGDVTLAEAKARVGRDLTIVGNIQHHELCTMPDDLFGEMVAETVHIGKEGGRYILCPTATPFGWPTMDDRARDNWLTMLEVGLREGAY